jgi:hypothetical protein
MASTQPIKTVKKQDASPEADMSATYRKPSPGANVDASGSSSAGTIPTATTRTRLNPTLTTTELETLRLKASLVAGYLGMFQKAGGRVTWRNVEVPDSGSSGGMRKVVFFVLGVPNFDVELMDTPDGLDFAIDGKFMSIEDEQTN